MSLIVFYIILKRKIVQIFLINRDFAINYANADFMCYHLLKNFSTIPDIPFRVLYLDILFILFTFQCGPRRFCRPKFRLGVS